MRYDAYRDNIQLIQDGKKVFLVKDEDIEAIIDGDRYQYRSYLDNENITSGYLRPLNNGNGNTKLYARTLKFVKPPWFPLNGYDQLRTSLSLKLKSYTTSNAKGKQLPRCKTSAVKRSLPFYGISIQSSENTLEKTNCTCAPKKKSFKFWNTMTN